MDRIDDFSNESDRNQPGSRDPLAERLRKEAMAERPPFSGELHHRILQRARKTEVAARLPHGTRRWLSTAAAAAVLVAMGLTALWVQRLSHSIMPNHSSPMANDVPSPASPAVRVGNAAEAPPNFFAVDIGDVFFIRFWPPEIILSLSMAQASAPHISEPLPAQAAPAMELPGSPEWLLARLQEQASSAQAALFDVIPPQAQVLLRQVNN